MILLEEDDYEINEEYDNEYEKGDIPTEFGLLRKSESNELASQMN